MKKILLFLALALVVFVGAHFLIGPPLEAQFQDQEPVDKVTQALDKNKDQSLSESELADAAKVLKSLDKNGDGKLTEEEVAPEYGRGGGLGFPGFGPPGGGPPGGGPGGPGGWGTTRFDWRV